MKSRLKYPKLHFTLGLFISAIIPGLVAGPIVFEFFILLSCLIFFFLNWKTIGLSYYKTNFFIIFLIFNIFLISSSLLSENILNSIKSTLFYLRFGLLILIIWYLLDCYKNFKFFLFYFIAVTFIVVISYALLDLLVFNNEVYNGRYSGIFGTESVQGSFLLKTTPIFIILYLYIKKHLKNYFKIFFYLILIFNLVLIVLSGERAAFFLTILGLFMSFIFIKLDFKKFFFHFFVIMSIIVLTIIISPYTKKRFFEDTYQQIFSINEKKLRIFSEGHEQHLFSAFIMFKENIFIGTGVRNFRVECNKDIYKHIGKYHCSTHPHNTYLQFLSETGLIGSSFFFIFIIFILSKFFQLCVSIHQKKKINLPLGFCLIIILVNFFPFITTGSFFNNWLTTLYFVPIGFLFFELNKKKRIYEKFY